MPIVQCANCNKDVFRYDCEINNSKYGRSYCDSQCRVEARVKFRTPPSERFWRHVQRLSPDECWEWTGALQHNGYGQFAVMPPTDGNAGRTVRASRYSWELHYGEIPDGLLVCHKCDNRKCVNPNHLFLGTPKDNTQDMIDKGKSFGPNTEVGKERVRDANKQRRLLDPQQVMEAKTKREQGATVIALAREYGVARCKMGLILRGLIYKD